MDVTCPQCHTEYEFDTSRLGNAGVTVKCAECAYMFAVRSTERVNPALAGQSRDPTGTGQWKLRRKTGETFEFDQLTVLQQWIIEQRVTRDDEVSRTGRTWRRLGDIVEFEPFFHVVDAAHVPGLTEWETTQPYGTRPKRGDEPTVVPTGQAPAVSSGKSAKATDVEGDPAFAVGGLRFADVEYGPAWEKNGHGTIGAVDDDFELPSRSAWRYLAILLVLLLLVGGGISAYFFSQGSETLLSLFGLAEDPAAEKANDRQAAVVQERHASTPQPSGVSTAKNNQTTATKRVASTAVKTGDAAKPGDSAKAEEAAKRDAEVKPESAAKLDRALKTQAVPTQWGSSTNVRAREAKQQAATASTQTIAEPKGKAKEDSPASRYETLVRSGDRALKHGQTMDAIDFYERAQKVDPNGVGAMTGLGYSELDLQRFSAALGHFKRAFRLDSDNEEALVGAAETYRAMGNKAKAYDYYRAYLRTHPNGKHAVLAERHASDLSRVLGVPAGQEAEDAAAQTQASKGEEIQSAGAAEGSEESERPASKTNESDGGKGEGGVSGTPEDTIGAETSEVVARAPASDADEPSDGAAKAPGTSAKGSTERAEEEADAVKAPLTKSKEKIAPPPSGDPKSGQTPAEDAPNGE